MAAPSLLFPPADPTSARDFAAEASLSRLRTAAMQARNQMAELPGVRVLGPEISSDPAAAGVRLAIDLRDTGRDAWQVACAMAGRGFTLDAASHRVIVVRLTEDDIRDATHHRLASALQLALWASPAS